MLLAGIPSLGMPPLDPLEVSEIVVDDRKGSMMTLSEVKLQGLNGMRLLSAR
jgi:hypothetical protein